VTVGARRPERLVVAIPAVALAAGLVAVPGPAFLADQHADSLLVVKKLEPDLLSRHDPSPLHVPLLIRAQTALARRPGAGSAVVDPMLTGAGPPPRPRADLGARQVLGVAMFVVE
jgi:hypothetical protein